MSAPRVVVVRPREFESDSRGKKFALSLARLGYDVTLVCAAADGRTPTEFALGPVKVRQVVVGTTHRDELLSRMVRRRTRINNRVSRTLWRRWSDWSRRRTFGATIAGMVPEVVDFETAFEPVLRELDADVLHVHHPFLLPLAERITKSKPRANQRVRLVYDAREFFAGLPPVEQGNRRRQAVLLRLESGIRRADAVMTVSAPIASALRVRYRLATQPGVVLNVPVFRPAQRDSTKRSVREDADLTTDVPLLVYSGGVNRSRGLDTLMMALPQLPDVHLAVVTVPFPHPQIHSLLDLAGDAADRVHVLPPVTQDELIAYLSSADVGVHPMPGGSPNHDMALPNKLFEYLHSGLTLVVSDAREMARFVEDNELGEVFASNDASSLVSAIRRALEIRRTRDAAAVQELARRFSWQNQEPTIREVYNAVAPGLSTKLAQPVEPFPSLSVSSATSV